jgi:pescadillo protein
MGKRTSKKTKGEAARFITRNQALRKLQLRLKDFRHLCILKGIFPKEPKKYFKGVNKTYYSLKDIKFLSNEKILQKFREIKAYEKKILKARKKHETFDEKRLISKKPTYTIDHIIRERYPHFIDALNDVEDALCLLSIFANLPKYDVIKISPDKVANAQRLLREFYLYIAVAQTFKKGFLTIKGIYLNTEISGQSITWLAPFNFPQKITFDVDYDVMLNFLELYTNLMKFVNFKLYKDIGLQYPPPSESADLPFFGFNSQALNGIQQTVQAKINGEHSMNKDDVNVQSEQWKQIIAKEEEHKKLKELFKNFVFYVSREVPREVFEMIITSCGGLYGDDADNSTIKENDERITHYIVDRPAENIELKKNKEYVQPQWVFDCVNSKKILPVSNYAPGKKLPPHVSPFYEIKEDGSYAFEGEDEYRNDVEKEEKERKEAVKDEEEKEKEKQLREMMLSNNKKKLLKKIKEENVKKKKKVIK